MGDWESMEGLGPGAHLPLAVGGPTACAGVVLSKGPGPGSGDGTLSFTFAILEWGYRQGLFVAQKAGALVGRPVRGALLSSGHM